MFFSLVRIIDGLQLLFFSKCCNKGSKTSVLKLSLLKVLKLKGLAHQFALSGAPNDGFLPNALKRCFRLPGELLKLCRLILGCAIKFISVRSF